MDWLSANASRNGTNAEIATLFPFLEAPEYLGPAQLRAKSSTSDVVDLAPFNETNFEKTHWSYFQLNRSISLDPGVLPYNSTVWLNNTPISLPAPFLDLGYNCSGNNAFTKLGNCVCYKGEPISLDILSSERVICNTAPGYVWGFSSYLTRVGLILEAVWMACCFICYLRLSLRSDIIDKESIRTAGVMRLALDFSESARNVIGPEANTLSESDLTKRLKGSRISYHISQSEPGDQTTYQVMSSNKPRGFEGRYSEELARWEARIVEKLEPWEGVLPGKVAHWEARLGEKLGKKLAPWDDRFEAINKRVDPVSDSMNMKFNRAAGLVKERLRSSKRSPTDFEVYEDLNWRI